MDSPLQTASRADRFAVPEFIGPRTTKERDRIGASLELLGEFRAPVRCVFVMPMYHEERRLKPFSADNPLGEDALRRKVMQVRLLHRLNPNVQCRLIAVDDGTPKASSARCVRKLWDDIRCEYKDKREPLDEHMLSVLVISEEEKKALGSKKGGALLRGLQQAVKEGWASHIGYTDVDISTNLLQTPLLLKPLIDGRAQVAIGSCWSAGEKPEGISFKRALSSKLFNLIVQILLPPLRQIHDTQRAFKIFNTAVVKEILPFACEPGFAIDTELLVLAKLSGKSIEEVPIAWIESAAASTIRMGTDSVQIIRGVLKQSRHLNARRSV